MSTRFAIFPTIVLAFAAYAMGSASEKPVTKLDLTGQWKWAAQRQNGGGREVTLDLKQDGEKLTGSVSGMGFGGDTDITDGSFKDGQITFKVTRSRGGQDITTTYTGKLTGDTIKGIVDTDARGNKIPREWEAHRVKDEPPKQDN
jgi:hypothetical protein